MNDGLEILEPGLSGRTIDIPGGTEPATVGTAPVDLQQKHVPEFRMGTHEAGGRRHGQNTVGFPDKNPANDVPIFLPMGQDTGTKGKTGDGFLTRNPGKPEILDRVGHVQETVFGLAHKKEIQGGKDGKGIEKGYGTTGHDQWPVPAVVGGKGDVGTPEQRQGGHEIALEIEAEADQGKIGKLPAGVR